MNNKPQLKKLKLSVTKRETKQINNFFSNETSENEMQNELSTNALSSKVKSPLKETELVLVLSDEEVCESMSVTKDKSIKNFKQDKNCEYSKDDRETVVSRFFNKTYDDFETPVPKSKQNPILKEKKNKNKEKCFKRRKKQTTIKSALAKNEEIFAEIMAQHTLIDNVNTEEMQIALACSLSESEHTTLTDSKETLICNSKNSKEIRSKLEQFGFKSNSKTEEFSIDYFLPKRKRKGKWSNKFTPLTLRCTDKQRKKIDNKIEDFLNSQFVGDEECEEMPFQLNITSSFLKSLIPETEVIKYFGKYQYLQQEHGVNIFYVSELFSPTKSRPHFLLKNFKEIPGRDFSPPSRLSINQINESEIILSKTIRKDRFKNNQNGIFLNLNENSDDDDKNADENINNCNERTLEKNFFVDNRKIFKKDVFHVSPEIKRPKNDVNELIETSFCVNQCFRAESPDIFNLSENEVTIETFPKKSIEIKMDENFCEKRQKLNFLSVDSTSESDEMLTYEKFSSDEVKILQNMNMANICDQEKSYVSSNTNKVVDLTHSDDSLIEDEQKHFSKNTSIVLPVDKLNDDLERIESSNDNIDENGGIDKMINNCEHSITPKNYNINDSNNFHRSSNDESNFCSQPFSSCNNIDFKECSPISQQSNVDDCVILSDDEVNYSIINSCNKNINKSQRNLNMVFDDEYKVTNNNFNKQYCQRNSKDNNEISFLEFIDENLEINKNLINSENELLSYSETQKSYESKNVPEFSIDNKTESFNFKYPSEFSINSSKNMNFDDSFVKDCAEETFNLEDLRKKYGILSNKNKGNEQKSPKCKKSLSESFLNTKSRENSLQMLTDLEKYDKNIENKNFFEISNRLSKESSFEDFDEFDKLIYGSPQKKKNIPNNFEKLLTAKIKNVSPIKNITEEPYELNKNDKTYLIRTKNFPLKPNYAEMDSPTRLKELYNFGLKPLKKNQAIKILEYIYNETHPIIAEKFTENDGFLKDDIDVNKNSINNIAVKSRNKNKSKFNSLCLRDFFWKDILDFEKKSVSEHSNEQYIFQTNISKKIPTVLLPFHLAWFNLVESNVQLKEAVLSFEPIDLQEIYLFLKSIGYRYEPKAMKSYFDSKCIIFRYDLGNNSENRNLRRKNSNLRCK